MAYVEAILGVGECFEGPHRASVAAALAGLLFYMPSAFLVGLTFLNDEKNPGLDLRFVLAYEASVMKMLPESNISVHLWGEVHDEVK